MTTSMHRLAAAAAGALSLGMLLAACASTSSSSAPATGTGTSASPGSSAPPAPAPATSAASSSAAAASVQIKTRSTSLGTVLTDTKGFVLYWFAKDSKTSSACSGACATFWPPVIGTPVAGSGVTLTGNLGTIKRSDGSLQATYDGHPLYTFKGDSSAGQVTGNGNNGFGALWWAMTTSGSTPAPAPASGASTAPATKQSTTSTGGGYGY